MELALIDAIGPFFRGLDQRRINWSKIPFAHLATSTPEAAAQWAGIREETERFATRVAGLGYTAVTLDDVAHLTDHEWYEPEVRRRIGALRAEFHPIITTVRARGLQVFVTSDFLTTSAAIDARLGRDRRAGLRWYRELVGKFLDEFPEVAGVILRIGESDGHDVVDPLRSRLAVRTAKDVREMLEVLLPEFEARKRRLIFRTWTVGAYLIGDLIWHRGRLAQAFDGLKSPALVVSMKYGESDFFRYLPLNKHFFRLELPTVVEFQARREYEGAGEYPSFVGWEVEPYAAALREAPNLIGFSVWCQTGGWHAFRRRAFLDAEENAARREGIWVELNAAVIVRLMRDRQSVEQAVTGFIGETKAPALLELLRRSDVVIREVLYLEEFARQKLFFRRVRIPPLLHVFWDCIFVNDALRKMLGHFVQDPEAALRSGEAAFENFGPMIELARQLELPAEDVEFMRDTFAIILLARRFHLLPPQPGLEDEIVAAKAAYKERWPRTKRQRYRIRTDFEPAQIHGRTMRWLLALFVRRQRGYRTVLDHLLTIRVLSWIYRLFRATRGDALPKFARKTAMGVDVLFR